jgi:hypothetical protein
MKTPGLNLDIVTRTATEAAKMHSFPVSVLGSVPSSGGSQYVEIVFRVDDCGEEPCRMEVGVFRDVDVQQLRADIGHQLKQQIARRRRRISSSTA